MSNVRHGGMFSDLQYTTQLNMKLNNRYVIDGWPLTQSHVDLLTKFHLTPTCIVELEVSNQEILRRAAMDRNSLNR